MSCRIRENKSLVEKDTRAQSTVRLAERGIEFHTNRIDQFEGLVPVPQGLIQISQASIANSHSHIAVWWPEFVDNVRQAIIWGFGKLTDDKNSILLCSHYVNAPLLQLRIKK